MALEKKAHLKDKKEHEKPKHHEHPKDMKKEMPKKHMGRGK